MICEVSKAGWTKALWASQLEPFRNSLHHHLIAVMVKAKGTERGHWLHSAWVQHALLPTIQPEGSSNLLLLQLKHLVDHLIWFSSSVHLQWLVGDLRVCKVLPHFEPSCFSTMQYNMFFQRCTEDSPFQQVTLAHFILLLLGDISLYL